VPCPVSNDSFAAALAIREADEGGETGEAGSGGGNAPQKQSVPALRSSASWRSQLPKVVHDFWDTALVLAAAAATDGQVVHRNEPPQNIAVRKSECAPRLFERAVVRVEHTLDLRSGHLLALIAPRTRNIAVLGPLQRGSSAFGERPPQELPKLAHIGAERMLNEAPHEPHIDRRKAVRRTVTREKIRLAPGEAREELTEEQRDIFGPRREIRHADAESKRARRSARSEPSGRFVAAISRNSERRCWVSPSL